MLTYLEFNDSGSLMKVLLSKFYTIGLVLITIFSQSLFNAFYFFIVKNLALLSCTKQMLFILYGTREDRFALLISPAMLNKASTGIDDAVAVR